MILPLKVRRALALLTLAAVAAPVGACATRPASNVLLLYYNAGNLENKTFEECIFPGRSGSYPIDDETFTVLTDTRTWNVAPTGGDSNEPIESGTAYGSDGQPGPTVKTWSATDFVINIDCSRGADSPVVRFWETLGRRYGISVDHDEYGWNQANWIKLLLNTLVVAQRKALAEGTRFYLADDLDSNAHGERAELEKRIQPLFAQELRSKLGGDFFCGIGFRVDDKGAAQEVEYDEFVQTGSEPIDPAKPDGAKRLIFKSEKRKSTCPPIRISITDIDYANPAIAAARADVYAAQQRAKAQVIAAQGELDKANLLGQAASNESYIRYKQVEAQLAAAEACKANPNCTVIIDGSGSAGLNVTARR